MPNNLKSQVKVHFPQTNPLQDAPLYDDVDVETEHVANRDEAQHVHNVEQAFLLFAIFCGDYVRTAAALDVPEALIKEMAEEYGWDKKLRPIIELKNSARPGDVERAVNRALNFVQAHKFRTVLEKVLRSVTGMTGKQFEDYMFSVTTDKMGRSVEKFSTRAFADLSSALEKCHAMTYAALCDNATDRREREEHGDDSQNAANLHLKLADMMGSAGGGGSIREHVQRAQADVAAEHVLVTEPGQARRRHEEE